LITGGVPAWGIAKSLVDEAIDQDPHPLPGGLLCFSALPRCYDPPGGRAGAQLKTWRILRTLRCCPGQAGQLAKAIHLRQARDTDG